MADRIFSATAGDLMTQEVEGKQRSRPTEEIYEWMNEEDYRVAPIYDENGDPIGYIDKQRIEDKAVPVRHYINDFSLSNIISTGATFEEVLMALRRRPYYFLGGADNLAGILTRSDVNQAASYIHLYERITYLEEMVKESLLEIDEDWKIHLNEGTLGRIKGRVDETSEELIDGAGFRHLIQALQASSLRSEIQLNDATKDELSISISEEDRFNNIVDLRNDVAHRNLILKDNNLNPDSKPRNVKDLLLAYRDTLSLMNSLEEKVKGEKPFSFERKSEKYRAKLKDDGKIIRQFEGDQQNSTMVSLLNFLIDSMDLLNEIDLPYVPGRGERAFLNSRPVHTNGEEMRSYRSLSENCVVFTSLNSEDKRRYMSQIITELDLTVEFEGDW